MPLSPFNFVIPNRPQPRLRGEDDEESAFRRSVWSRAPILDFRSASRPLQNRDLPSVIGGVLHRAIQHEADVIIFPRHAVAKSGFG